MKKIVSLILISVLILLISPTIVAVDTEKNAIEYFDDGSYLVTTLETFGLSRATKTITGKKTATYKDSDDTTLWSATLTGTFSYTGSSATCTASSITYSIVDDSWKITSATASKSQNQALGNVIAKRYTLGIPFKTIEKDITITCSASGTLS